MFRMFLLSGAAMLAWSAVPASAQSAGAGTATTAAARPTVGATVYDTTGNVVGTVDSVNGDVAVVATGKNKVGIPLTSFGKGDKGPLLAMTRDQLDQAAAGAKAQQAASVTQGATVMDSQGVTIGTVKSVDSQYALVDMQGTEVKLPLSAFATRDNGLMLGMTKAQLEAAAKPAAGANAGSAGATPPS